jgi:predicted glutamine amidotransferase
MCRLFGQIALKEKNATDFLVDEKFSLLAQSYCDRKRLQEDGWGIASWSREDREWRISKSEKPIFSQKNKFKKNIQKNKSQIIIAHIRNASNPKKLQKNELIGLENTQPFYFRNLIFAHNGTLNIPDEIAERLGVYKRKINGVNDSEVLFWLFVKLWRQWRFIKNPEKHWKKVFCHLFEKLRSTWKSIPKKKFKAAYCGLNCIVSDGKSLAALCYYDAAEGKSLCGQGRPYFEMCYNVLLEKIAIASEPMDESKRWKPIPNRHILVIRPDCSSSLVHL